MISSSLVERIRRLFRPQKKKTDQKTPRHLRLLQLEDRRVLNGALGLTGIVLTGGETLTISDGGAVDVGGGIDVQTVDLTLETGTWGSVDGGIADTLYDVDGTGQVLTIDATLIQDGGLALDAANVLSIQGADNATDHLVLDLAGLDFIPAGGIDFVAGEDPAQGDDDSLSVVGYDVSTVIVTNFEETDAFGDPISSESGSVELVGLGSIRFAEIEPMFLGGPVANLTINLPAGADATVVLSDDGIAANGISSINGLFEQMTFSNPTNSLTINDGTGAKTISVQGLDSGFAADLSIIDNDGTDDNIVTFDFATKTGGGDLTVEGGSITVNAAVITGGGDAQFTSVGDIDIDGTITTAAGDLLLIASGNVAQSAAITGTGLGLMVTGTTTLTNATNSFAIFAADNGGETQYRDVNGINVGSASAGITITGIETSDAGADVQLTVGGNLAINEAIALTDGDLFLAVSGNVTQSAAISGNGLGLMVSGPTTLNDSANDFATISADVGGVTQYTDANMLAVGDVATPWSSLSGIMANGNNVKLTTNAGDLSIDSTVTMGIGDLALVVTGDLTQTAEMTGRRLGLMVSGETTLNEPTNSFTTFASNNDGVTQYTNDGDLIVGNVSVPGLTITGITTTCGDMKLTVAGNLAINSAIVLGIDSLFLAVTGAVTQTAAISGAGLGLMVTGTTTLANAANSFTTIAAMNGAAITYVNTVDLTIGMVTVGGMMVDDVVTSPSADISITATSIFDGDAFPDGTDFDVDGRDVTLTATTGNIGVTSGDIFKGVLNPLEVRATNNLVANAVAGSIALSPTVTLTMTFGSPNVALISPGAMSISDITVTGDLRIEAANVLPSDSTIDLAATRLLFKSGVAETINTTVEQLDVTTGGTLIVNETDAVELIDLDCDNVAAHSTTAAGNVLITAAGTLLVSDDVIAGSDGTTNSTGIVRIITTGAAADIVINDVVLADDGTIIITAGHDVLFGADFAANDTPPGGSVAATDDLVVVTTVEGSITITAGAGGAITMSNEARVIAGRAELTDYVPGTNGAASPSTISLGAIAKAGGMARIALIANGDITLGSVQTTNNTSGAVRIATASGAVVDGGDANVVDIEANFAGAVTTIEAVTGVGDVDDIETTIAELKLTNTTSGNVNIDETDAIRLQQVLQREDDSISIIAGGTITVLSTGTGVVVDDLANGDGNADILLQSEAGDVQVDQIVRNDSDHADADISLDADGLNSDVNVTAAVRTAAGDITITADDAATFTAAGDVTATGAGNVSVTANTTDTNGNSFDEILMSNGAVINAGSGTITLSAIGVNGGNITLGGITTTNATAGAVDIDTSAGVIDGGDTDIDIVANVAGAVTTINSVTGVGSANDIETTIAELALTNTTSGNVNIDETDAIRLQQVLQREDDSISVIAGGAMTVLSTGTGVVVDDLANGDGNADILLQSEAGDVQVDQIVRNDSDHADADISLDADGLNSDVNVAAVVSTAAGDVTITADDAATFTAAGDVTATGAGNVSVTANTTDTNGNSFDEILMSNGAVINAGSGTITLSAVGSNGGNITLGGITTTNATAGAVDIDTSSGVIDGGDTDIDIVANVAGAVTAINSVTGVGAANDIETTIAELALTNTTSGNVNIDETDAIRLQQVLQREDDSISVIAGGAMTVLSTGTGVVVDDLANGDGNADILLQSEAGDVQVDQIVRNDSDHADADISLDADGLNSDVNVTAAVSTAAGDVTITADDRVMFTAAGDVTATGAGNVSVTANTTDTNGNSFDEILMSNGAVINAGSGTITLSAVGSNGGNITLGGITTTNATAGAVDIDTSSGVIDGGDTDDDIVANTVGAVTTIDAITGIGSGNSLEVQLDSIDGDNVDGPALVPPKAASGNIEITEVAAGGSLNIIHLDNDANASAQGDTANGVVRAVVESGTLTVLADVPANTFVGGVATVINAAVQSENMIHLESTAGDVVLNDSVEAIDDNGIEVDESISVTGVNVTLANNQVISTDDDLTIGSSVPASGDFVQITATGTVTAGGVVNIRTDGGLANRFLPVLGVPVVSSDNVIQPDLSVLNAFDALIGNTGELNLRVHIDWRDPTNDGGGLGMHGGLPLTSDRYQTVLAPTGGVSQTFGHIYKNFTDIVQFSLAGVTAFKVDFSVSHHESIQVQGASVVQGLNPAVAPLGKFVSSTDNDSTGTFNPFTDDNTAAGALPPAPADGNFTLAGSTVEATDNTDLHFETGLIEFKVPTTFPPIFRADPPVPELPAPPVLVIPQIPPKPVVVTAVELEEAPLTSYSTQSEDYFQLRLKGSNEPLVFREGTLEEKSYKHIDDDIGWKLLQPRRLKQWVDDEDLINGEGYELWLITTKVRNGQNVTFERPVLRFDVFDQQPFPMAEELLPQQPEFRLERLDIDEDGNLLKDAPDGKADEAESVSIEAAIDDNVDAQGEDATDQKLVIPIPEATPIGRVDGGSSRAAQSMLAGLAVSGLFGRKRRQPQMSPHTSRLAQILHEEKK